MSIRLMGLNRGLRPFYRKLGQDRFVMTETPPSEDSPRNQSSRPVEDSLEDSPTLSDRSITPGDDSEGESDRETGAEGLDGKAASTNAEEPSPQLSDGQDAEHDQEAGEIGRPVTHAADISLFSSSMDEQTPSSGKRRAFQEIGWKMMAVAGIVLLAAGFVAGVFFPEAAPEQEVAVATTATTVPAVETPTTTTSAVPTTASTTSPPTSAPSTTVQVEPVIVPPPDLVVTDEPVSDVANRLVPSVVHLEIGSENLFEQGAGSGVVFDSNGYILTAAHVVETVVNGDAELTVRLSSGDRMPGEVVGTDPDSDVAVVKVQRSGLIPAELALQDQPRVGQMVVAVGSPWGLESSVTSGVISAVDRIVEGRLLHQSDAVLYPGNSGGALADRYGRLIGINVSIFTDSTTLEAIEFQGVGFAVPIDVAYRVAQALIAGEPVHVAFLGVSGRDTLGDAGVEIMEVFPGSGAERAGLQVGDIVVAVGGQPVTGISDLAARIRHLVPGDVIVLDVRRGDEELLLAATLLARSDVLPDESEEQSPQEESEGEEP